MMTNEELVEFRVALVRSGLKLREWCEQRGIDRVRVSQQLHRHFKMQPDVETAIREFMNEYEKEVGNVG